MVVETVFGAILVLLALVAGVGGPLLAIHFQQRDVHERHLIDEVNHQQEIVADYVETVDRYREVTQLAPEDVGSPLASR